MKNILLENLQINFKFHEDNLQELYKVLRSHLRRLLAIYDRLIFSIKMPLSITENFKLHYYITFYQYTYNQ